MTVTKSRRATTSEDRVDIIAKSASVTDLDKFLDESGTDVRDMVAKLWSIYGGERGDKVVQYTQKHHSALLSILGHHDGLIMLLMRALADSIQRLKTLETGQNEPGQRKAEIITRTPEGVVLRKTLQTKRDDDGNLIVDVVQTDVSGTLTDLQKRVSELEENGARFRGVYQRALPYRRGDQTTFKGSLWTALDDVPEGKPPGENVAHWQLAAKGAA